MTRTNPIRIVGYVDEPLVNECFDQHPNKCNSPGFEAEYIYNLLSFLLIPIEWIRVDSYETMLDFMDNRSADITACSMMVDESYGQKYGYALPYINDALALYVKETKTNCKETLLLLTQFSWDLWFALLFVTLSVVCIRYFSHQRYKNGTNYVRYNKLKTLFQIFYSMRSCVLYYLWMLFLAVILNFYGNLIPVDLLTSSKTNTFPVNSMTDLGQKLISKECRLALYEAYLEDVEFHGAIINPNRHNKSWAPLFRQAYQINPPIYTKTREDLTKFIANSSCIIGLDWMSMESYYTCRQCNIKMLVFKDEPELLYDYTFYHTRDDIRDVVNTIMVSDSFRAFPETLAKKYYNNQLSTNCPDDFYANSIGSLGTNKLQTGFYGLFIGIGIAMIIFVLHILKRGFSDTRRISFGQVFL